MRHAKIEAPAQSGNRGVAAVTLVIPGPLTNHRDLSPCRTERTKFHVDVPRWRSLDVRCGCGPFKRLRSIMLLLLLLQAPLIDNEAFARPGSRLELRGPLFGPGLGETNLQCVAIEIIDACHGQGLAIAVLAVHVNGFRLLD